MPPPARATVEEIEDEDDPYAPYRPGQQQQQQQRSRPSSSSSASSSASSTDSTASSTESTSASSSRSANRYGANLPASDIYEASPSSGTQGAFPREGGDEEPLFGGRPFRDTHTSSGPSSSDSSSTDKEHLYALLNLPTDASPEAIKDSYRSLAVVLHPDKHNDPSRKAAAESRFREVQRAYEILSDPEKRAIYDYFGEEGLKSSWSVAVRGRSPREMQEEFEREKRRREVADAEGLVKSKGEFTAHIDATALFAHPSRLPRKAPGQPRGPAAAAQGKEGAPPQSVPVAPLPFPMKVTVADRIARVGCTQLIGKHGFETQVTNTTSATFSGQMVSRNGLGGGNLVGTVKTHWSPRLFSEVTLSFLRPQIVTMKGQYTVDANSFFTWQSTLQTPLLPPTINVTYGQRLSSKSTLTGFSSFRSGTWTLGPWGRDLGGAMVRREPAAVSVGLTKQIDEGHGWTTQTSISPVDQNISFDYAMKLLSVKLRTGFNLGTGSGVSAFTSAERRLTENVRLSLGLTAALPMGGVTLRVKLNRLGQKIMLPIQLSPEFRSDLVVLFTVVPAAAYSALHYGYLEPKKQKRLRNRLSELRGRNSELIMERRTAAVEALSVLRDTAVKKALLEMRRGGLVVLEAWYGRKADFPSSPYLSGSQGRDLDAESERIWEMEKSNPSVPSSSPSEAELAKETYWDVRVPVQALVNKGQIIVPGGRTKANLLGFHDPVMGEKKHLRIIYVFRGAVHLVEVDDWAELAAPMRIHQVGPASA